MKKLENLENAVTLAKVNAAKVQLLVNIIERCKRDMEDEMSTYDIIPTGNMKPKKCWENGGLVDCLDENGEVIMEEEHRYESRPLREDEMTEEKKIQRDAYNTLIENLIGLL